MAGDDDVTIKIAGDVKSILDALDKMTASFTDVTDGVKKFAKEANTDLTKVHELLAAQLLQTEKWGSMTVEALGKMQGGLHVTTASLVEATTMGTFFGGVLTKAFDAVVEGVTEAARALPELVKHTAEAGEHFLTLSAQTGVSVKALSQLQYVGSQTSTSMETITRNVFVMSKNLGAATEGVQKATRDLGLNLNELRAMKPEESMLKIIDALKGIPNAAKQAQLGTELFGRGFRSMRQLVNQDVKGLMQEADQLGLSWTKAAAEMGEQFNNASNKLHSVFDGIKQQIGLALLPAATAIMKTLADTFAKLMADMGISTGKWQDSVQKGVRAILLSISTLVEVMTPLLARLAEAMILTGKVIIDELTNLLKPWVIFLRLLTSSEIAMRALHEVSGGLSDALALSIQGPLEAMVIALQQGKEGIKQIEPLVKDFADKSGAAMQGFAKRTVQAFDEIIAAVKKGRDEQEEGGGGASPIPIAEIEKFKKTIKELQEQMDLAHKAGTPLKTIMESLGPAAVKAAQAADLLPGGIKMMTQAIIDLAKTANSMDLVKIIDTWATPIEKQIGTWEDFGKKVEVITAGMVKDMLKVSSTIDEFTSKLNIATKVGLDKTLATLAKEENDALAKLGAPAAGNEVEWAKAHAAITAFYADARLLAEQYTGDAERDADARGIKSQQVLDRELATQKKVLAEMLADRKKFNAAAIADQQAKVTAATVAARGNAADVAGVKTQQLLDEEVKKQEDALAVMTKDREHYSDFQIKLQEKQVLNAKAAAGKNVIIWHNALDSIADALTQLGKGWDNMFGKIMTGAGSALSSLSGMSKQIDGVKAGFAKTAEGNFSFSGIISGLSNVASMAGTAIQIGQMLWKTFAKSPEEKVAEESLRDFGVKLSSKLTKSIVDATADFEKKGGGRMSAELSVLGDIIKEGGGLSGKNVAQFAGHMHDMFSEFDRGVFSIEDLTKALGDTLPIFAEFATKSESGMLAFTDATELMIKRVKEGKITAADAAKTMDASFQILTDDAIKNNKVISQSYLNVAKDAKAAGIELKSTADFQKAMYDKLQSGLKAAVSKIPEVTSAMDTLFKSFSKKEQDQLTADYQRLQDRAKNAKEDFKLTFEEFIAQQGNAYNTLKEGDKNLQTVFYGGDLEKFNAAKDAWQGSFDRLSRISLASFNSMVANGKSAVEAMDAIGDSVDTLIDRQDKLGLRTNSAFDELKRFRSLISDNKELVESVGGLNDVMLALANTGSLTQDTMDDLEKEGVDSFHRLTAAGFTENEALAQMKPFLMTAIKLNKDRGLAIDENTKALIEQAEKQGIITADEQSVQDVLKEGLTEIIKALKGDIPEAWAIAGKAGVDAAKAAKAEQDKLNASIEGTGKKLDGTDWDQWGADAEKAAGRAKGAIDEVTYGASPGGIKDVIAHMATATTSAEDFANQFTAKMAAAAKAAKDLSQQDITPELSSGGLAAQFVKTHLANASGKTDAAAMAGDKLAQFVEAIKHAADQPPGAINLVLKDQTTYGTEAHVENVVLPNLINILRRGRRLRDMQNALEVPT